MVSLLPYEVKQKNIKKWTRGKNLGLTIFVFTVVFIMMTISMMSAAGVGLPLFVHKFVDERPWAQQVMTRLRSLPREEEKKDDECNPAVFKTRKESCANILACKDGNLFQYIRFCYTWHWATWPLWYIPMALYVLICFEVLGSTAGDYFSPALVKLSDYLRLPPNIAGVTLLALGNGAPDLSAIIVSTIKGETDVGLSGPVGGGMFVSCFVFGAVCIFANVKVARRPYLRDVGFYLIACLFVSALYFIQYIPIVCSILFFVIYGIYVGTVMIGRMINQRFKKSKMKKKEKKEQMKKKAALGEELLSVEEMQKAAEDKDKDSEGEEEMDSDEEFDWTASYKSKSFMQKLKERKLKQKGGAFLPKMGLIVKEEEPGNTVVIQDYFSEDKGKNSDRKKKKMIKKNEEDEDEGEKLLSNEETGESAGDYEPPVMQEDTHEGSEQSEQEKPAEEAKNPDGVAQIPPGFEKQKTESDSESSDSESDGNNKKQSKKFNNMLQREKEATPMEAAVGNIQFIENVKEKRVKHQNDDDDDSSSSSSSSSESEAGEGARDEKQEKDLPKSVVFAKKITSFADWIKEALDWEEKSFMDKVTFLSGRWILNLLRNITCYQVEEGAWSKPYAVLVTLCFPTLILTALSNMIMTDPFMLWFYPVTNWPVEIFKYPVSIPIFIPFCLISLAIGVVPAIFVFFTTKSNKPPIYEPLFVVLAFVLAIIWIYLTADTLVGILKALGLALGIPKSILALTLLAWGNSIGDLFGDIAIAQEGYPSMAVGACFGSPLMNVMLGLGIGMTLSMIIQFFQSIPKFIAGDTWAPIMALLFKIDLDPCVTVGSFFLIFGVFLSLTCVPCCCFNGTKVFGVMMILYYCVFLVTCVSAGIFNLKFPIFDRSIRQNFKDLLLLLRICPEFVCDRL